MKPYSYLFLFSLLLAAAFSLRSDAQEEPRDISELEVFEAQLRQSPEDLLLASEYRQKVIAMEEYRRSVELFEELAAAHPNDPTIHLSLGYALVDKIPVEGSITQVLLANRALDSFTRSLDLSETWLGCYTRGHSYVFWPPIFGRTKLGIADLERAIEIAEALPYNPLHSRAWVALGDAYWRLDDIERAREIWSEGKTHYPDQAAFDARLSRDDPALNKYLGDYFDPLNRVDTDLTPLWPQDRSVTPDRSATPGEIVDQRTVAAAPAPAPQPRFEEIGAAAGVRFVHSTRKFVGRPKAEVLQMFTDGGSAAAAGDFDDDGDIDLFVTDSDTGKPNHLMRNEFIPSGELRFSDIATASGVAGGNDASSIVADAVWFDYDNDGHRDLLVARFGTPLLYRNLGPGENTDGAGGWRFEEVAAAAGLNQFGNTIAVIAFDADRDGYLDLLLGNYFQPLNLLDLDTPQVLPNNLDYADNGGGVTFWRNVSLESVALEDAPSTGGRGFVEVTEEVGFARHTGWTLDVGHADLNGDGWPDVYLAGDYGTDRLFFNNGDGTFREVTEEALGGFDTKKGMNVDIGDYDRNGHLDVYVTNITDEYMRECNMLWHNVGDGTFLDLARETGTCDTDWGWAGKFGDFDNDGWEDLFVVNGLRSAGEENYIPVLLEAILSPDMEFSNLHSYPDIGDMTWSGYQKQRLFHNLGDGTFREAAAAAGVDNDLDGRGIAMADYDNDGLLDLYQTNANQPALLYRGTAENAGHWVQLRLRGTRSNRDAIGARVLLTTDDGETYLREVNGGNAYASSSSTRVHIGIGTASRVVKLEVRWPSGSREIWAPFGEEEESVVPVNAVSVVVEGERKIGGGK